MVKKTKLPFFSKNNNGGGEAKPSWPWPSCHQPRTHSFRTNETPESSSWFSNSSESSPSFTTASDHESKTEGDPVESIVRGVRLRSERLFFEPGESKILKTDDDDDDDDSEFQFELPFKETSVLSMDSLNPLVDFGESMEDMVEAHGLKDLESLAELLGWYLKANGKSSHGYILGAFIDLLIKLESSNHSSSSSSSPSFYTSSYSLSSSSSSENTSNPTPCDCESSLSQKKIIEDDDEDCVSS